MKHFFENGWVWLAVTLAVLALCAYLPVKIRDDNTRRLAYWVILIPASLVLMLYSYPAGLEVFRRLALTF